MFNPASKFYKKNYYKINPLKQQRQLILNSQTAQKFGIEGVDAELYHHLKELQSHLASSASNPNYHSCHRKIQANKLKGLLEKNDTFKDIQIKKEPKYSFNKYLMRNPNWVLVKDSKDEDFRRKFLRYMRHEYEEYLNRLLKRDKSKGLC